MIYLTGVIVGLVGAVTAVVLGVAAKAALSLSIGEGAGSIGFAISTLEIAALAVAGFAAAFWWRLRRGRRRASGARGVSP